jgi:hypothetical protein
MDAQELDALARLLHGKARLLYTEAEHLRRLTAKLRDAVAIDTSKEDTRNGSNAGHRTGRRREHAAR